MSKTALLLIDIQNDYFSSFTGAKWPLVNMESAAEQAEKILSASRKSGDLIVHVRHQFPTDDAPFFAPNTEGVKTHSSVLPNDDEPVITKHQINSFHETDLKAVLDENKIENVIIVGAMSHMCIDAVTRAAHDYGYACTVIHDACATLNLNFNGKEVSAEDVHATYMSALAFAYASVITADEYISNN